MTELKKFLQNQTRYNIVKNSNKITVYKKKFKVDEDGNTTNENGQQIIKMSKSQITKQIADLNDMIADLQALYNLI